MIDEWLDAMQVAERLHVRVATVHRYASDGRLRADGYVGRTPLWRPATIDRYVAGMTKQGRTAHANRAGRGHGEAEQKTP
jgi:predicted site-specific integrase-resolvase